MMNLRTWTPEEYSIDNVRNNRVDAVIYTDRVSLDCQITRCVKKETALRRFWQALEAADMTGGLCLADAVSMLSDANEYRDGYYTLGAEYDPEIGWNVWYCYKVEDSTAEDAEQTQTDAAPDYTKLDAMLSKALNTRYDRGAWDKAVTWYALTLLDDIQEQANEMERLPIDGEELERWALNGASCWEQYSNGGCSICYDADIAARVCTPSELKRKHGGMYEPNSRETWLDVQARALYQACNRIRSICRTNGLYCKEVQ